MKKIVIPTVLILICIVIGVLFASYLPRLKPSLLCIHVSGTPWNRVSVQSHNLKGEKVFQPADTLIVSPIEHGVYTVSVKYPSGEIIWTQFFHSDASVRRRIDLFFDGNPKTGRIRIRETANGSEVLFEGWGTPGETSPGKPLRLDWI